MKRVTIILIVITCLVSFTAESEARWYSPGVGRFLSEDPIGFAGGDVNLYRYVGNNPVNYTDPWGLSWIEFDSSTGMLYVYPGSPGTTAGPPRAFPAANNADSTSRGAWQPGTYTFDYWVPHKGAGPDSAYGSYGNFVFVVDGCSGCGVHSGRANSCDKASRCGINHATMGCIRTTDAATRLLRYLYQSDPIEFLGVK